VAPEDAKDMARVFHTRIAAARRVVTAGLCATLQDKARKCVPTFTLYKEAHAAAQAGGTNVRCGGLM
jgi:hypothetical protein